MVQIRLGRSARRRGASLLKRPVNAALGWLAVATLKLVRRTNPERISGLSGRLMQRIGPWLSEHQTGRANLKAAFPEKSAQEIEAILAGVWDNLGRIGAEYAHLDRLWNFDLEHPERGRIELADGTHERFNALRAGGKPAVFFAAHLANWELPAVGAAAHGVEATILYRPPNIGDIAAEVNRIRAISMGTLVAATPEGLFKIAGALERGGYVAMLIDQHYTRGVDVTFFGRTCKANPMVARLARHFDCEIHGVRAIRLPGLRFRLELTPAVEPVRDAQGQIDVTATMQSLTSIVESWVREYPDQWLWVHRRWR